MYKVQSYVKIIVHTIVEDEQALVVYEAAQQWSWHYNQQKAFSTTHIKVKNKEPHKIPQDLF